ncbi:MAG: hypothetical protein K0S56_1513 [Microvirga sp.]|jgi:hypothetical protein|nr:hypothetical protein [Microvirga sp.]
MTVSDAAFALFTAHRGGAITLTRAAGSFCGEIIADPRPLTPKQADWLAKLLAKAGLPALEEMEAL